MKSSNYLFSKGLTYFVAIKFLEYIKWIDGDTDNPMGGVNNPRALAKTAIGAVALTALDVAFRTPTYRNIEAVK